MKSYLDTCPECGCALVYGVTASSGSWVQCSQCGHRSDTKPSYTKACNSWNKAGKEEEDSCDSDTDKSLT